MSELTNQIMELIDQHPDADPLLALLSCQVSLIQTRHPETHDQLKAWGYFVNQSHNMATKYIMTGGETVH